MILAAGAPVDGLLVPLARFGKKTALAIAVENCRGLAPPVVVLGYGAARVRPTVPREVKLVVNPRWRRGQLSSLLVGLRRVPRRSAFLLYPVDYPLLTRADVQRLVKAFRRRVPGVEIVAPIFRRRSGHPVLFSATLRKELRKARTAKEVVFQERRRLQLVPVGTAAIWQDFRSPAGYGRRLREFSRRRV